MDYQIIPGKRYNSNLLYHGNYIYRRRSNKDDTDYYSCYNNDCPGTAKLSCGILSLLKQHNHDDDGKEYLKMMFLTEIKTECREQRIGQRDAFDKISRKQE